MFQEIKNIRTNRTHGEWIVLNGSKGTFHISAEVYRNGLSSTKFVKILVDQDNKILGLQKGDDGDFRVYGNTSFVVRQGARFQQNDYLHDLVGDKKIRFPKDALEYKDEMVIVHLDQGKEVANKEPIEAEAT